ncbi:MAG: T9SS type A sorting domain-containing protein [Candidatus Woesearchaeota archaeon]
MKKKILLFFYLLGFCVADVYSQKEDILPVELLYFESLILSNGVLLRWGTATEVNNFGFEVQRADSPYQFYGLDFVPGNGNSNSPKHYLYVDTTLPGYGIYYYRLKQIDNDGSFHYSDTLTVNYFPASVVDYNQNNIKNPVVFHNPETNQLNIYLSDNVIDEVLASIFSITGEKVEEIFVSNPSNPFKINHKSLPTGVYVILLSSKSKFLYSQKFLILK